MSIKEAIKDFIKGPPGLQRMCTHPDYAAVPSYEDVPGDRVARHCGVCGGQQA
jgi:hypothetical protein